MKCEQMAELLALRALDLLEPREEAVVREHLESGCPRCAGEAASLTAAVSRLPLALPEQEPSPMARQRLMAAVRNEPPRYAAAPHPAASRIWMTAAAASLAGALLGGLIAGMVMTRSQERLVAGYEQRATDLQARISRQEAELAELARQVEQARQTIQVVSSPGVVMANLAGQGQQAETSARIFWDPAADRWRLFSSKLPAAPEGRAYQLWLVTDAGRKISAGVFDTREEASASGRVSVPAGAGRAIVAAVTLEPAGGSEQPTTDPFLVGRL